MIVVKPVYSRLTSLFWPAVLLLETYFIFSNFSTLKDSIYSNTYYLFFVIGEYSAYFATVIYVFRLKVALPLLLWRILFANAVATIILRLAFFFIFAFFSMVYGDSFIGTSSQILNSFDNYLALSQKNPTGGISFYIIFILTIMVAVIVSWIYVYPLKIIAFPKKPSKKSRNR